MAKCWFLFNILFPNVCKMFVSQRKTKGKQKRSKRSKREKDQKWNEKGNRRLTNRNSKVSFPETSRNLSKIDIHAIENLWNLENRKHLEENILELISSLNFSLFPEFDSVCGYSGDFWSQQMVGIIARKVGQADIFRILGNSAFRWLEESP